MTNRNVGKIQFLKLGDTRASSKRHTLPKQDNMHSISEVIILNNYQHQNRKQQWQTTGLIQRLGNNIQHLSIGVIVSETFCFRNCLFVVYNFALHGQQFSCQTGKGNSQKHIQFLQGVLLWRMHSGIPSLFTFRNRFPILHTGTPCENLTFFWLFPLPVWQENCCLCKANL